MPTHKGPEGRGSRVQGAVGAGQGGLGWEVGRERGAPPNCREDGFPRSGTWECEQEFVRKGRAREQPGSWNRVQTWRVACGG